MKARAAIVGTRRTPDNKPNAPPLPFQGHERFHDKSEEQVRELVMAFEFQYDAGYRQFMETTRKRQSVWECIQHNPISPMLLLAEYYYMVSATIASSSSLLQLRDSKEWSSFAMRLLLAIWLGIYCSSLLTGLGHLVFDNLPLQMVPREKRPLLEFVAFGFQNHHAVQTNWSQQDVLLHGVFEIGTAGVTLACVVFFMLHHVGQCLTMEVGCGLLAFSVFVMNVQVIHAFAHNTFRKSHPRAHAVYVVLARMGLVLDNRHHHIHHTLFDRHFGITNHWADPVVDWLYRELLDRGYIAKEMRPEVQRETFIEKKRELRQPYYQIFPDWRYLHEHGDGITRW